MYLIASLKGLTPSQEHGIHIHAVSNFTEGCNSTGAHYNPANTTHGSPVSDPKHVGDLGNIAADANGIFYGRFRTGAFTLKDQNSVIGRAIVVHAKRDDLGKGGDAASLANGNSGVRIGCCEIT